MKLSSQNWSQKLFYAITLASFLWAMSFGIGMIMKTDGNGAMPGCPFMAENTSICQMSLGEHILKWTQTFAVILSIISLLIVLAVIQRLHPAIPAGIGISTQFAEGRESHLAVFNPLTEAFSDGILNPKIYPRIIS